MTLGTVVNGSGLGTIIARAVFANLPMQQGQDFVNFMSLALLGAGTSVFTTMAGVPAVLTPLTERLAENTGFTANAVLMTQVVGFSSLIFPYQAAPLMVAMGLAGESTRPLARVVLLLFIVSVLVLMPLEYLWWKVLGEI